jgi:thiamine pyrophosphate-dependent acetolactate synthase large subunit-like protein
MSDVPGPVFLEFPLDVLYPKNVVTEWYFANAPRSSSLMAKITRFYLRRHFSRLFSVNPSDLVEPSISIKIPKPKHSVISKTKALVEKAKKPLLLVSSQALLQPQHAKQLASYIEMLGIPAYLSGMARGLLGRNHPLHIRHKRRNALKEADLIILAGIPVDFRLDYGFAFNHRAKIIAINRNKKTLSKNVTPTVKVHSDVYEFFSQLLEGWKPNEEKWKGWLNELKQRDAQRDHEIIEMSQGVTEHINPLSLLLQIEEFINDDAILIGDGGDFVASVAYTIRPRKPLGWLDPGVFGTLGSGGGFALAAKLVNPKSEVWVFYGDGSVGYTLMEWETFARHKISVIGIIGNDAGWTQIERDQTVILGSDVATKLAHSDYDKAAIGLGAQGIRVSNEEEIQSALEKGKSYAMNNQPCLINAIIGKTDFRKGSISV